MQWHCPLWFFVFVPWVFLIFFLFAWKKQRVATLQYSCTHLLKNIPKGFRSYLSKLPVFLKILAMALLIIALARPREPDAQIQRNVEGIDILVALDISDSMLIEDMEPANRLEAAKKTIEDFVTQRISDRMALLLFSGESFTQVPLTLDYTVFLQRLRAVKTIGHVKMGTAIGVALANGVGRLKDSKAKSRIIILLTDGENNTGTIDPETALEMAKGYGLRIYTIGVGQDGMAQIPVYIQDVFGNQRKRYQPIHSKINEQLLKHLALETGGRYFRAMDTPSLQGIFDEINTLETSKIQVKKYERYQEQFQLFLKWALLFFALSLIFKYLLLRIYP